MLKFNFLNLAKPKKVFEKLNKMDRKQAYTVGAIIVVAVISLLMLVSSLGNSEDPMADMNPTGYDLASMPFVNDEAEKMLLASYYPDMKENSGSFLYTPLERERREQEDEEYELVPVEETPQTGGANEGAGQENVENSNAFSETGAGRGRGYGSGRGRGTTEIGKMEKGSMAAGGGSGFGATWGPSVDNRGLQGQTGYTAPAQVKTSDGRKALQQFRAGSIAAARLRDNKMANARKAMQGGNIQGSQAFGKDGSVDVSKLGGLALDPSEMPKTTDLDNLDKAVDNAVKDAQKKDPPKDELGFWERLGQDMLRSFATGIVDAVTTGVGDAFKGWVNGNSASRAARKQAGAEMAGQLNGKTWETLSDEQRSWFKNEADYNSYAAKTNVKDQIKDLSNRAPAIAKGKAASAEAHAKARGSTPAPSSSNTTQQYGAPDSKTCNDNCQKQSKNGSIVNGMCVCS